MNNEEWESIRDKVGRFFRSAKAELHYSTVRPETAAMGFGVECGIYRLRVSEDNWSLSINSHGVCRLIAPDGKDCFSFHENFDEESEKGKRFTELARKLDKHVDIICGMLQILPLG